MNLRVFNQKYLGPGTMALMIIGILFLCQPWSDALHAWSVLVMLVGLIGFNVSVHIPPPVGVAFDDEENVGPVSVTETVREAANG